MEEVVTVERVISVLVAAVGWILGGVRARRAEQRMMRRVDAIEQHLAQRGLTLEVDERGMPTGGVMDLSGRAAGATVSTRELPVIEGSVDKGDAE